MRPIEIESDQAPAPTSAVEAIETHFSVDTDEDRASLMARARIVLDGASDRVSGGLLPW